jgi:hypothetical protein
MFWGKNVMNCGGLVCRAGGGGPKIFQKDCGRSGFFLLRMDREKKCQRWMSNFFRESV